MTAEDALNILNQTIDIKLINSGAKDYIKEVLKSQISTTPYFDENKGFYCCSNCKSIVFRHQNYCDWCEQRLDFTKGKE